MDCVGYSSNLYLARYWVDRGGQSTTNRVNHHSMADPIRTGHGLLCFLDRREMFAQRALKPKRTRQISAARQTFFSTPQGLLAGRGYLGTGH